MRDDVEVGRPTMHDVAKLAGVSHQTVSRVLNDRPNIRQQTRHQVENAILQLGYRRNAAARALVTRRTSTLGVVSVDTSQYGPARTIFGIEEAAREAGYFVNFASLRQINRSAMRAALDQLTDAAVEGIVVIAPVRAAVEAVNGLHLNVPLVMVADGDGDGEGVGVGVGVDQVAGARLATRHLLDLGHRTVVHVRGPQAWVEADLRAKGWLAELTRARATVPKMLIGDWSAASGYTAGIEIAQNPETTAVFAGNDQMALGVMRALHEAGRSIPGDVSLVGFDDIPEAEFFHVPLTTVRQDFAEVGRRCLERLLALLAGQAVPVHEAIQPLLVIRNSSSEAT